MFRQIGAPRTARFTRVALGSRAETRVLTRLPGATRVKRAVLGAPICRNHAFYDAVWFRGSAGLAVLSGSVAARVYTLASLVSRLSRQLARQSY